MAKSIKKSLRENQQDLVDARIPTKFTNKDDDPVALELRRQMFIEQAQEIGKQLDVKGISEKHMLKDFKEWRKERRKNNSR